MIGAYSEYQTKLSNLIIHLRDEKKMTYKAIAEFLITRGYKSPRGFNLSAESVFSIYKKRNLRKKRLESPPSVRLLKLSVNELIHFSK